MKKRVEGWASSFPSSALPAGPSGLQETQCGVRIGCGGRSAPSGSKEQSGRRHKASHDLDLDGRAEGEAAESRQYGGNRARCSGQLLM